jgi:Fe-S-cluster containining protein
MARRPLKKRSAQGLPTDMTDLHARIDGADLPSVPAAQSDRARRVLIAWLNSAKADGQNLETVLRALASGSAARQIGAALRGLALQDPPEVVRSAACAPGCAFCCILTGNDGGTITADEARTLHAALLPFAGQPDGRDWHPQACAALDPETRLCRAYDARPGICRSFYSTDAKACEINAMGGTAQGAGVLGAHLDYLAVHALVRAALAGAVNVHSYALRDVAATAVAGQDRPTALTAARHPLKTLPRAHIGLAQSAARVTQQAHKE